jgi:type II secretory pathway component PulK
MRRRPNKRGGFALAMALLCLAIAGVVFVVMLQQAAASRVTVRRAERTSQAEWLAESAIERAVVRLQADGASFEETWTIPAEQLGGRHGASIEINTADIGDSIPIFLVNVVADYPAESPQRKRVSRTIVVGLDGRN